MRAIVMLCWLCWALPADPLRADTYVVDQNAPGAADTNAGDENAPFKTLQRGINAARPGDTVAVMAGTYTESIRIQSGGSPGQPITVRARPRRCATVKGFDVGAGHVRIEGFEITADKPGVAVHLGGSNCEIIDNYIHEMKVAISGTAGNVGADGTRDYSAVSHNRIAYNKVYRCEFGFVLGGEDWLVENNEVNRLVMFATGQKFDDCDYSRFFGKRCVQRCNYYHGSTAAEIRVAHVDCLQTFTVNGEIAQDLLFEDNTCFDFHQMCMVESAPRIGSVSGWVLRRNIVSANSPAMSGGWGPDIIQTQDVTIENNTISSVRWATIGLRGKESTNGRIVGNILCDAERSVIHGDRDFTPANPAMEHNLTFKTSPVSGQSNVNGKDPLFVDAALRNFRLRDRSAAIGVGPGGTTAGALEYPNAYYVDPRHPACSDNPAWGYPAVPLATLEKAMEIAQPGETIVLKGGVYREVLRPSRDNIIIKARMGERVWVSGADVLDGWSRQSDGRWSAEMKNRPRRVLRDGQPYTDFIYDSSAGRVLLNGDPRLHLFETVVRAKGIDLGGTKGVRLEGIEVRDTLD